MPHWLVRVEGVNFEASILDTNDLSTIRGGGLALLHLAEVVEPALARLAGRPVTAEQRETSGASQYACRIELPGDEAAVAKSVRDAIAKAMRDTPDSADRPPFSRLMAVVDVAEVRPQDAADHALRVAEARNHTRQFRQWTVTPVAFDAEAEDADRLDGVSPARAPKSKRLSRVPVLTERAAQAEALAPAVAARRNYGRKARQRFYREELTRDGAALLPPAFDGADPLSFTDDLQAMVEHPPREVPISLRSKIAVVYADGNAFGDARAKTGVKAFSRELGERRQELLAEILAWYGRGARSEWQDAFAVEMEKFGRIHVGCRFETILWGGDEMAFVLPSWLATAFVEGFFAATKAWEIGGVPLSHAVGVALGDRKTPIRQLRKIAKDAAEAAKEAKRDGGQPLRGTNSVTFEIFESLAPPDADLGEWRKSVYGADAATDARAREDRLALQLALPGDDFEDTLRGLEKIVFGDKETEGFPRSQLYAVLRLLREKGIGPGQAAADAVVKEELAPFFERAGAGKGLSASSLLVEPVPGVGRRGPAMDIALLVTLWDYASPFAGIVDSQRKPLPSFAGVGAGA